MVEKIYTNLCKEKCIYMIQTNVKKVCVKLKEYQKDSLYWSII